MQGFSGDVSIFYALQVLESMLSEQGNAARSPTLQCVACTEDVANEQAVHYISGCSHVVCVSCAIGYVRANVDTATLDLYPFRCPAFRTEDCSGHMVDVSYLQLVSPELLDDGVVALSLEEVQRYDQQQVFAAIPAYQRMLCPHATCNALLFNPGGQDADPAQNGDSIPEPERMWCSHCEHSLCQTCSEA